jgi:O-antigen/teichoic acid export membrane protein
MLFNIERRKEFEKKYCCRFAGGGVHTMGIVIRKSGFTAILSYIGFFIGYINMLWLLPYAFRPEEIGLIRLLLAIATMFATLFSFGGSQVVTRYFPYFAESVARRTAFSRLLIGFSLVCAVIFSIAFILFHNKIADIYSAKSPLFISYLWYLLPLTVSLILYGMIEASTVVQGNPLMPAVMREVYTRFIMTFAAIAFIAAFVTLAGFFWFVTILYCLSPIILFIYGSKQEFFPVRGSIGIIQKNEFRELSHFGAFMFLGNASAVVLSNIDSVILSAYSGLTSAGIYGIAMVIAVIIEIPKRSLSQVLIPMVVKANKEDDRETLDALYKKSSLNQFIIGSAIFLMVWMNIDGIFSFIPNGQIYSEGKWVVFFISLAKLFDMLTGINAEIIGTSRYYKIDLFIYFVLTLVGIYLNFLLIPRYGLIGAAIAAFSSIVLYNTMRFIFIAIAMKIQPFTRKILFALLCTLVTYGIVSLVPDTGIPIISLILRSVLIGIIFGGTILWFHVSEDISNSFQKVIIRLAGHK